MSKSSSRVEAAEESNSSGACDFTGENTFRCGILCFPVYCVRPCIASYVIRMPVAKLGLAPPCLLWDPAFVILCLVGQTLSSVKPCLSVRPSVRPCILWGFAFCEALPSVRVRPQFNMWHLVFCETMPLFQMWNHALCESLLWVTHLAFCETLPSVRPCLLWDPGFCDALPSARAVLLCCLLWDPAFD